MKSQIELKQAFFSEKPFVLFHNDEFEVTLFRYDSGIEAVTIKNSRGEVTLLPYMGQMIWDLAFDGISLRMKNMFRQPKAAQAVVDTYGCFAFHSGLLANGCPSPEDTHLLHGEMPCAKMDKAWILLDDDSVSLGGCVEYVQGFGHHYQAKPAVCLSAGATKIEISMQVENMAAVEMPLQYMCHMNYAYMENGKFYSNLPATAFKLRESIPAHVKPTEKWLAYNEDIKKLQAAGRSLERLDQPAMYDPEIVFMADEISQYGDKARIELVSPEGHRFVTEFSTQEFNYATRWILYNEDQQVAAFVLPGTCRPEGFLAAQKAGSLIMLKPGECRAFTVVTGLEQEE